MLCTARLPPALAQRLVGLRAAVSRGVQLKDHVGLSRGYETPVSIPGRLKSLPFLPREEEHPLLHQSQGVQPVCIADIRGFFCLFFFFPPLGRCFEVKPSTFNILSP